MAHGHLARADECLEHCDVLKLSATEASRWHRIRGSVLREAGQPREGFETFRECIRIAESANLVQLCLGQIALFNALLRSARYTSLRGDSG